MKTIKDIWDWFTVKRIAEILNIVVVLFVVQSSILWVSKLGITITITRTVADLITTFALIGTFWISGYMLGATAPKDNDNRQL